MKTDEKGRPLTYWGGLDKSKKQTAVEWLIEQIIKEKGLVDLDIKAAKKMEKEQIINAFHRNSQKWFCEEEAEQYYNETFKQQEQ
jgi:hypothetical protein